MSVTLMTAVWPLDIPPSDKLVLLALADAAHDDGLTWIAVRSKHEDKLDIIKKTSLSERSIQGAIKRLCEDRYLHRKENPGRGVLYVVDPLKVKGEEIDLPAVFSMTPAKSAKTPAKSASTPAASAPKPSSNRQVTVDSSLRSETGELALLEGSSPPKPGTVITVIEGQNVGSALPDDCVAYNLYQDMARKHGLPVARGFLPARQRAIGRILKLHGLEVWKEAIERTASSDHLRGINDRGWTTSLDWMTNPTNFQKIIEGNYNRTGGRNGPERDHPHRDQRNADASIRGAQKLFGFGSED